MKKIVKLHSGFPDVPEDFRDSMAVAINASVKLAYTKILKIGKKTNVVALYYNSENEFSAEVIKIFQDIFLTSMKCESVLTEFEVQLYNLIFGQNMESSKLLNKLNYHKPITYSTAPRFIVAAMLFDSLHDTHNTETLLAIFIGFTCLAANTDSLIGRTRHLRDLFATPNLSLKEPEEVLQSLIQSIVLAAEKFGLDLSSSEKRFEKVMSQLNLPGHIFDRMRSGFEKIMNQLHIPLECVSDEYFDDESAIDPSSTDEILDEYFDDENTIGPSSTDEILDEYFDDESAIDSSSTDEILDEYFDDESATDPSSTDESLKDSISKLNQLIGLQSVKDDLGKLLNFLKVQSLREQIGHKKSKISLHMVFTGPPGTGKTTVARILANIYGRLGFLEHGHFTETDRSGLVGGYLGETAIKTKEVLDSALGGILFIDEAYALSVENDSYGQEAIDTILKYMEDHRDNLIIVVAGYRDLMNDFINSNPGLKSRFNRYVDFPDYKPNELVKIFKKMASDEGYDLSESDKAEQELLDKIKHLKRVEAEKFGNARSTRNLFERVLGEHANRIAPSGEKDATSLSLLTPADIKKAGIE